MFHDCCGWDLRLAYVLSLSHLNVAQRFYSRILKQKLLYSLVPKPTNTAFTRHFYCIPLLGGPHTSARRSLVLATLVPSPSGFLVQGQTGDEYHRVEIRSLINIYLQGPAADE
jgi:hypothetical protein